MACLLPWLAAARVSDLEFLSSSVEMLVEVELNTVTLPQPALVRLNRNDELFLRRNDLQRWRVALGADVQSHAVDDELFVPVISMAGVRARLDKEAQRLILQVAPQRLPATVVEWRSSTLTGPTPSIPGGFIGYDLVAERTPRNSGLAGQLQVGGFSGAWSGATTALFGSNGSTSGITRLETWLQKDSPDRQRSLRMGDTVSRAALWGTASRYAGIQWATDFELTPGFIAFPLPPVRGEAVVPSVVDIYVNNSLRSRHAVPAGPFEVNNLPVVSGSGDLRVVVRDALGREQVFDHPYFVSTRLLKSGLSAGAFDMGFAREDYVLDSFDYGPLLVSGAYRHGVTDRLTTELHADYREGRRTAGASILFNIQGPTTLFSSLAFSHGEGGHGWLSEIGAETIGKALSGGIRLRVTGDDFDSRTAYAEGAAESSRRELYANLGINLRRWGTLGLVHVRRSFAGPETISLLSLNYGLAVGTVGFLNAFATVDARDRDNNELAVVLTLPLGRNAGGSLGIGREDGKLRSSASVTRSLPAGNGFGYRVRSQPGSAVPFAATGLARNHAGTFGVEYARLSGESSYQATASGGAVLIGNKLSPVRTVDGSFALVEVTGQGGIDIYVDNHPVARTDAAGLAILPGLRPYETNRLSIDPLSVPLDVDLATTAQTVQPYRHGGVKAYFPAADMRGFQLQLIDSDGKPVPPGATVRAGDRFYTVVLDGIAYIAEPPASAVLEITWATRRCLAAIPAPGNDILPHLGRVECVEAAR